MPYWSSDADGCDHAFSHIGVYTLIIKEKMFNEIAACTDELFPEQSLTASLICLRIIVEQFPKRQGISFSLSDILKADELFMRWYSAVEKKIPKKYRAGVLETYQIESARIKKMFVVQSSE
jgi:hypothetical protein